MLKKSKKQQYNIRRIKKGKTYTVYEIAVLFNIHKSTVRAWCKQGLSTIDTAKPLLIHGTALSAFLKKKKNSRKSPLTAQQFYCLKCRAPRLPAENMIDCTRLGGKRFMLTALCSVCGGIIHKIASAHSLPENVIFQKQI